MRPENEMTPPGDNRQGHEDLHLEHGQYSQRTVQKTINHDVVTIVRDPARPLGKRFTRGRKKESTVTVSVGLAVQRHVPTAEAMAEVLREVSEDPNAALINAGFRGIPIGEEFVILSEKAMAEQLRLRTREERVGVHNFEHSGRQLKAACRIKENVTPSCWQLLDRDVDGQTPTEFGPAMDFDTWLGAVERLLPGVAAAPKVRTGSSSARVLQAGKPVGGGNGHLWVQIADASDAERLKAALVVRAAELGMAWRKLNKHGANGSLITIFDPSVFTVGRLVFCGKPTATDGLEVISQNVEVLDGETPVNTSLVVLPPDDEVRRITRKAGAEMSVRNGRDGSLAIDAYDLELATAIELEDHGLVTVGKAIELLNDSQDKLRCQTPFRDSESMAGVLRLGAADNRPCLFDVGTGITHWLCNDDFYLDFEDLDAQAFASVGARLEAAVGSTAPHAKVLAEVATLLVDVPQEKREASFEALLPNLEALGIDKTEAWQQVAVQTMPGVYQYDITLLLPEEFVVEGFISAGLTTIAGAPGVGKTSLLVPLAAIVAHLIDSPLQPVLRRKVVYFSEAPKQVATTLYGLHKMAAGAKSQAEFSRWFTLVESRRLPPKELAKLIQKAVRDNTVLFNGYPVAPLIVLDTSNATIDLENENDNAEVGRAIAALKENMGGSAIWLVAHTAKAMSRTDVSEMSARGAGAFAGDSNATAFVFREEGIPDKRYMAIGKHRFEADFRELEFSTSTATEYVRTPWGTEQRVTYRVGFPAASDAAKRAAAAAEVKEAKRLAAAEMKDLECTKRILEFVESAGAPCSKAEIEKGVMGNATHIRGLVQTLADAGSLVAAGTRKGHPLYSLPAGVDDLV
ncbi:MAG: hypothetical protein E6Q69_03575 [Aquipseudomonas alcaligenes]|uniref:Uncharacterized protein n=1 Tax=Aquipseudomonas alcaligenes TaxID=43263 RepID=A0A5C7WDC6_AQUAC|nr:MAG: hypothetical protein E6Q69_03575 [Pseudomonas alcaligenes]